MNNTMPRRIVFATFQTVKTILCLFLWVLAAQSPSIPSLPFVAYCWLHFSMFSFLERQPTIGPADDTKSALCLLTHPINLPLPILTSSIAVKTCICTLHSMRNGRSQLVCWVASSG